MFDHFRQLFLYTFQLNTTLLYLLPLTFTLKDHPEFLLTILLSLITIFRSYPCVGDIGFYFAFLPLWKRVANCKNFYCVCEYIFSILIHSFVFSHVPQLHCVRHIYCDNSIGTNRVASLDLLQLSQRKFLLRSYFSVQHSSSNK